MNYFNHMSGGSIVVEEIPVEPQQKIWLKPSLEYNPSCAVSRRYYNHSILHTSTAQEGEKRMKRHYAHISFASLANGVVPVVSRKRKRTAFTTDQVAALEEVFRNQAYVTREEREVLVQRLGISDQAIKVWFQNRRLKQKKEIEEQLEEALQAVQVCSAQDNFSLRQQVNNDGFVAQQSVDELVNDIDVTSLLGLNINLNCDLKRPVSKERITDCETKSITFYEPISPPETSETNTPAWLPTELIDPLKCLETL